PELNGVVPAGSPWADDCIEALRPSRGVECVRPIALLRSSEQHLRRNAARDETKRILLASAEAEDGFSHCGGKLFESVRLVGGFFSGDDLLKCPCDAEREEPVSGLSVDPAGAFLRGHERDNPPLELQVAHPMLDLTPDALLRQFVNAVEEK